MRKDVQIHLGAAVTIALLLSLGHLAAGKARTAAKPSTKPATLPSVDTGAVKVAQQKLEAARADLQKAQAALDSVVDKLRKDFQSSSDWTTADAALKQAESAYTAAKAPLLQALHNKPEYVAAVAHKEDARKKVDALRDDPNASQDQITQAATDALEAAKAETQMEQDALADDPKVSSAKSAYEAAAAKTSALEAEFDKSLASNADWKAAKAKKDTADKTVSDDEIALAAAINKAEQEQAAREKAIASAKKKK